MLVCIKERRPKNRGGVLLMLMCEVRSLRVRYRTLEKNHNFGPAATSDLPSSLPQNFVKFLMKRAAKSLAFSSH